MKRKLLLATAIAVPMVGLLADIFMTIVLKVKYPDFPLNGSLLARGFLTPAAVCLVAFGITVPLSRSIKAWIITGTSICVAVDILMNLISMGRGSIENHVAFPAGAFAEVIVRGALAYLLGCLIAAAIASRIAPEAESQA